MLLRLELLFKVNASFNLDDDSLSFLVEFKEAQNLGDYKRLDGVLSPLLDVLQLSKAD